MGKNKITSFKIFTFFLIVWVLILVCCTIVKLINVHNEKLTDSMRSNVLYYARRCYLEEKCSGTVTLKDLYDLGYMAEVVDPITKQVIDYNLAINYENNQVIINWP